MRRKGFSLLVFLVSMVVILCACQAPTQHKNEDLTSIPTKNASTSNTQQDNEPTLCEWQIAYLDFIEQRESEYAFDYRYALVHIDNDDIPELYAVGICEADGDHVYSYKNGRVIEQRLARMFGGKYVERSGIMINQNGHMGSYYDIVYKLDENGFSAILNAYYTERYVSLGNDEFETVNEYFIDSKPVTKDEYDSAISASIDLSQTVNCYENSVSYDVIKKQITDCK